ncbi:MAG TPA: hypothetical protein DDZ83_01235 [Nitrospinae bacterium]|nr:hypothetical protein [Nitrospinota bacterium]
MQMNEEKREFTRFAYPSGKEAPAVELLVFLPELADGPLHPEDFSTGGFKVKLTKCPAVDDRCGCDIQVYGVSLANLKGRVVRVEENGTDPKTWSVGLSIDIPEDDRDRLSSLLMAFINGEEELVE